MRFASIKPGKEDKDQVKNTIDVKIVIVITQIKLKIIHVNGCEFASADVGQLKMEMLFLDFGWDAKIEIFEISLFDLTGYPVVDFARLKQAN